MPVRVEVEGVGTVEFGDEFRSLTPAQQQAAVNDVAARAGRSPTTGLGDQARTLFRSSGEFARGFNTGVAGVATAPVDIAAALTGQERAVGSSDSVRRALSGIGGQDLLRPPGEAPAGIAERGGEMLGAGMAILAPLVAGPAGVPASAGLAGARIAAQSGRVLGGLRAVGEVLRGARQTIRDVAVRRPGRGLAGEVAGSLGAAAGGEGVVALSDDESLRALGEIAGGFVLPAVPLLSPTVMAVRAGARAAVRDRGLDAATRGRQALLRAEPDPERALAAAEEPVLEGMSFAMRTNSPGLIALEKAAAATSAEGLREYDRQLGALDTAVRATARDLGAGRLEDLSPALTALQARAMSLADARMRLAAQRAQERLSAAGPKMAREQANLVAREEIEAAETAVEDMAKNLWSLVPLEVAVAPGQTRAAYNAALKELRAADPKDTIPAVLRRLLGNEPRATDSETDAVLQRIAESLGAPGASVSSGGFGATVPAAELHALRSEVLRMSRAERARPDRNDKKLRNLGRIQAAILEDLGAERGAVAGPVGESYRTALDFSRVSNDTFSRGEVGRMLGRRRTGDPTVRPGLTLETSLGSGPKAREAFRDIVAAVRLSGREPGSLLSATEDFLKSRFAQAVVRDGRINPVAGDTFLRDNAELLKEIPELQRQFSDVITTENASLLARDLFERVGKRIDNPSISKAALFIERPLRQAFDQTLAGSPARAARNIRALQSMAARDTTGDAAKGLKSGFIEYLLAKAELPNAALIGDEPPISGRRLRALTREPAIQTALQTLFTPDELGRLDRIVNTALRSDTVRATPAAKALVDDTLGFITKAALGLGGAATGRALGRAAGAGGTVQIPGIVASAARQAGTMLRGNSAARFVADAIQDRELFRAAVADTARGGKTQEMQRRAVRAWLAGIAAEKGGSLAQDTEEEPGVE